MGTDDRLWWLSPTNFVGFLPCRSRVGHRVQSGSRTCGKGDGSVIACPVGHGTCKHHRWSCQGRSAIFSVVSP